MKSMAVKRCAVIVFLAALVGALAVSARVAPAPAAANAAPAMTNVGAADPAAFKARFGQFLEVCHQRGLKVMPALFDDCVFGPITDPVYGPQPVVVPGWYANGWTPSPGHATVRDRARWPRLEKYVKDMLSSFKDDPRVWLWDLYNEPTNGGLGEAAIPLVNQTFDWARVGRAGFGTEAPDSWPRTPWATTDIWLRRSILLPEVPRRVQLFPHHDEDVELYLNGQPSFEATGFTATYHSFTLPAAALAALRPGVNLVAVHCKQTSGGQYIDAGLATPQES